MRLTLIALVLAACTPPAPPPGSAGPAEAVQAFSDAVQKGDAAAAWSLLSTRTQQEADALAKKSGAAGGREMLFGSAIPTGPVTAHLVSEKDGSAQVRTSAADGGAAKEFHAVRENGRWRVDLALGR